jgi:hypothetical protein
MGDYIDKIAGRASKGDGKPDAVVVVAEGGGYDDVKQQAIADLADVLGVKEADREEFGGALTDLIAACMKEKKKPAPVAEESEPDADDTEE